MVGDQIIAMATASATRAAAAVTPEVAASIERGRAVYGELCFSCHGTDGRGAPREGGAAGETMAPPLSGSPRVQGDRDYIVKAVMYGLTGPIDDRTFTEVMVPMGSNKDEWIADVASYVRTNLGNAATPVSPADVARVRLETANRKASWTVPELMASLPVLIPTDATWKVTASHNSTTAGDGMNFVAWSSGTSQTPGMWFQVELPAITTVSEVRFGSTVGGNATAPTGASAQGGPGGGRAGAAGGRAAGPAGAPPAGAPPRPGRAPVALVVAAVAGSQSFLRPMDIHAASRWRFLPTASSGVRRSLRARGPAKVRRPRSGPRLRSSFALPRPAPTRCLGLSSAYSSMDRLRPRERVVARVVIIRVQNRATPS